MKLLSSLTLFNQTSDGAAPFYFHSWTKQKTELLRLTFLFSHFLFGDSNLTFLAIFYFVSVI
jgi:hypothetical protein